MAIRADQQIERREFAQISNVCVESKIDAKVHASLLQDVQERETPDPRELVAANGDLLILVNNIVLLGDAAHTAHFSIGSGTKLAIEDSIALAKCFKTGTDLEKALAEFQRVRKPVVDEYQDAAYSSLLFFENAESEMPLDPIPFAYKLMTRSKKIDYEKLKQRDPEFIASYDKWKTETKGKKAAVRGQKSEVRGQKAEGGGQKAEGGRQKAESGRQKAKAR